MTSVVGFFFCHEKTHRMRMRMSFGLNKFDRMRRLSNVFLKIFTFLRRLNFYFLISDRRYRRSNVLYRNLRILWSKVYRRFIEDYRRFFLFFKIEGFLMFCSPCVSSDDLKKNYRMFNFFEKNYISEDYRMLSKIIE